MPARHSPRLFLRGATSSRSERDRCLESHPPVRCPVQMGEPSPTTRRASGYLDLSQAYSEERERRQRQLMLEKMLYERLESRPSSNAVIGDDK